MTSALGRRARLVVLSCLCVFVAASGASLAARHRRSSSSKHQSPSSISKKLHRVNDQKQRMQGQLRRVKEQQQTNAVKLNNLEKSLDRTENRLQVVTKDVSTARDELGNAKERLHQAEDELQSRREVVAERLQAIYQEGEVDPLQVVFQSNSFEEFADGMYLVSRVAQRDAEILDDLDTARTQADEQKQRREEAEQRLSDLQRQVQVEKSHVVAQRQEVAEEKARLMHDRAYLERSLAELEASSRELAAMLWRFQRSSRGRGGVVVTPWHGSLYQPVQGRITSPFGYRVHPILGVRKLHTGVDIAAGSGTPIHAAASGVVVNAGWVRGYGNCIVLDHGGGLGSLYGHCSRLAVSNGQPVKAGQIIGYVGSTGLSTGPHLHFEVIKNGRQVNPFGSF